jgi:imidazoleglycerol-phosphate dehydratase
MKANATAERKTKETDITVTVYRDKKIWDIDSGIGFFDHMLNALFLHAGLGIKLNVTGDLHIDAHHTVEDTGMVIGAAIRDLLEDKKELTRFGESSVPMDEALAKASVDIGGRAFFVLIGNLPPESSGLYTYDLTAEFFRALCQTAGITLHLEICYGVNGHHMVEALYKAAARAIRAALVHSGGDNSTKGGLDTWQG